MIAPPNQDVNNLALGDFHQSALTDTMERLALSQTNGVPRLANGALMEEGRKLTGRKVRNQVQHGGWGAENWREPIMVNPHQMFVPQHPMQQGMPCGPQYPNQRFSSQGQFNQPGYFPGGGRNHIMQAQPPKVRAIHAARQKGNTFPPKNVSRSTPAFHRSLSAGSTPVGYCSAETTQITTKRSLSDGSAPVTSAGESTNETPLSPDDGICLSPPADNSDQGLGLVGKSVEHPDRQILSTLDEESGSDDDITETHPNKFPIAIEMHTNRNCGYKRQPVRSGPQVKVIKSSGETYNTSSLVETPEVDQEFMRRYYRKDLVRVCVCGRYDTKEPLLENRGRDNDADGYEVHYSIKCRWKSYEDFKTKTRVIIRLCKCYKPSF